jgi:hypothetical protein
MVNSGKYGVSQHGTSEYGDSKYVESSGTTPLYDANSVTPVDGTQNVTKNAIVRIDIYDPTITINPTSIQGWINGVKVYDGISDTFISEYDGPLSEVAAKIVDGYNGYGIVIDKVGDYQSGEQVSVTIYAEGF